MRKITLVTLGLIFFAAVFVACFDEKDFEFDKFTLRNLEPTLHIPLVDDTIRLSANNDYNVFYDEAGVGYLSFDINESIMPDAGEFFKLPDATHTISSAIFTFPGIGGSTPVVIPSTSYQAEYHFEDGQQIDSIVFKGGTLTFNITSTFPAVGSYNITIPELKDITSGKLFSADIPFDAENYPSSLAGYSLKLENNAFSVGVGLTVQSSSASPGDYSFNADIAFNDVKMERVDGYFGSTSSTITTEDIDVSAFDKFSNASGTVLRIKEAYLNFDVRNGAGFPILLKIDKVKSTSGGQSSTVEDAGSTTITANELGQAYSTNNYQVGGEKLGEVLSNMPSKVKFGFSAKINPEGSKGGTVKNFLTDASKIEVSNVEARIPLEFSVSGMVLRDTLDFNTSDVTFKDMKLLMNIKNSMPVGVALQAYLLDGNGVLLRDEHNDIIPLFEDSVIIPAAKTDAGTGVVTELSEYKETISANGDYLAQAKKISVEITVASSASGFVSVTKDNYIHLKIGAKTSVNIGNFD
jgi:hypothetical protein